MHTPHRWVPTPPSNHGLTAAPGDESSVRTTLTPSGVEGCRMHKESLQGMMQATPWRGGVRDREGEGRTDKQITKPFASILTHPLPSPTYANLNR